jgi:UDP-glucose 4-epimerase
MRVLVTGAAGFIGSHLVRALLSEGHDVTAIDNMVTGQRWRVEPVLHRIRWMEADICNREAAHEAVRGVDAVLHQAAIPSVARSVNDPLTSNEANVTGTLTLLQACREAKVRRLVLAASSSAYGHNPQLPKIECMFPAPMSPYAVSKVACEQYCQVFAQLGFLETVCLRYFNVFGPMQDPASHYAAVIPKFAVAVLRGERITVHGDGSQSRDFTYIDNVVQANLLALNAPNVSGEVMNIGCGARYSLMEMIELLETLVGKQAVLEHIDRRAGDVPHSLADISKARSLLGYAPAVDFREGLRRTVEWFQNQEALKTEIGYSALA